MVLKTIDLKKISQYKDNKEVKSMVTNESSKEVITAKQEESQGKEKSTNLKDNKDIRFVERVNITKVEG